MSLFCLFDLKKYLTVGSEVVQPNEETTEENHCTDQANYNSSEKAVYDPGKHQEYEALKQQNGIHENDNPNQIFLNVEKANVKIC